MPNKHKQIQYQGVEYAQFKTLRLVSILLYAVFGGVFILSMWFLYTRMYQTIGQVETLSTIGPRAGLRVLDVDAYERVNARISTRDAQVLPVLTRDPMNAGVLFTPETTTNTIFTPTTTVPTSTDTLQPEEFIVPEL